MPGRKWTEEQRARQAEVCRRVKPWKHSSGPRTFAGKLASASNGFSSFSFSASRFSALLATTMETPMSILMKRLCDVEEELMRLRARLAMGGSDAKPADVLDSVFEQAERLQQAAAEFVREHERAKH